MTDLLVEPETVVVVIEQETTLTVASPARGPGRI